MMWMVSSGYDPQAVLTHSKEGNTDLLRQSIASVPSAINDVKSETGETALIYAAWNGNVDCVKELVEAGAKLECRNKEGMTAFLKACAFDHPERIENYECVKILLERRANVEVSDNAGRTALMLAAERNHFNIVQLLIDCSADMDAIDYRGESALFYAVKAMNIRIINELICAGAGVSSKNVAERGLFDIADELHRTIGTSNPTEQINPEACEFVKEIISSAELGEEIPDVPVWVPDSPMISKSSPNYKHLKTYGSPVIAGRNPYFSDDEGKDSGMKRNNSRDSLAVSSLSGSEGAAERASFGSASITKFFGSLLSAPSTTKQTKEKLMRSSDAWASSATGAHMIGIRSRNQSVTSESQIKFRRSSMPRIGEGIGEDANVVWSETNPLATKAMSPSRSSSIVMSEAVTTTEAMKSEAESLLASSSYAASSFFSSPPSAFDVATGSRGRTRTNSGPDAPKMRRRASSRASRPHTKKSLKAWICFCLAGMREEIIDDTVMKFEAEGLMTLEHVSLAKPILTAQKLEDMGLKAGAVVLITKELTRMPDPVSRRKVTDTTVVEENPSCMNDAYSVISQSCEQCKIS